MTTILLIQCTVAPGTINAQPQSQNNTYYVNGSSGSNTNTGSSPEDAWKTIQKAANSVVAGDIVIVMSGYYPERVLIDQPGSANAPITFQANINVITRGFTILTDHIIVRGFEITDTQDDYQNGWGIFVDGSNNIIEDNYIYYATRGGITLFDENETNDCIVRNNRLYRNAHVGIEASGTNHLIEKNEIWGTIQYHPNWNNPPAWVDADGIRFFGEGHIIRKNYIHDISYTDSENVNPHIDCFQTWTDEYKENAKNVIIEQNLCLNLQSQAPHEVGQGLMINHAENLIIRNNIIQAYRVMNILNSNSLTIVNNTLTNALNLTTSHYPGILEFANTPNCVIKNNIFYNPLAVSIELDSASNQGADIGYNDYYRNDGREPSGSPYPNDLWMIDPQFVNATSGDFHLEADSTLIDAGAHLSEVSNDYEGNTRPHGIGHDIGAYEFVKSIARNIFYFPYFKLFR